MPIDPNDVQLQSFIEVSPESDFPIQNLPYGIFKAAGQAPCVGVAIGDWVLDLAALDAAGLITVPALMQHAVFARPNLNVLMTEEQSTLRALRAQISYLLRSDVADLRDNVELREHALLRQSDVELVLPVAIGAYTDFYSSKEHASNLGRLFRGNDNPLTPNWTAMPIAYDGRASAIVVSGTDFHRPKGQIKPQLDEPPMHAPTQMLDVEVEMACYVGKPTVQGQTLSMSAAAQHLFGMSLLNDWSARDIQKWEYVPLGPFLGKNFCTSVSPWIVTLEALAPFRVPGPEQDPVPLAYLQRKDPWNFAIQLQLLLQTETMSAPAVIADINFKHMYWDCCQQLTHHTMGGCPMRTGDVFASGTVSGPEPGSCGSLIELTQGAKQAIDLTNGEQRYFLQDNDQVIIRGWCQGKNYRVGFGEVCARVLPAN